MSDIENKPADVIILADRIKKMFREAMAPEHPPGTLRFGIGEHEDHVLYPREDMPAKHEAYRQYDGRDSFIQDYPVYEGYPCTPMSEMAWFSFNAHVGGIILWDHTDRNWAYIVVSDKDKEHDDNLFHAISIVTDISTYDEAHVLLEVEMFNCNEALERIGQL